MLVTKPYLFYKSVDSHQKICPGWGSNSRPSDYETDALPTALPRHCSRKWIKNIDIASMLVKNIIKNMRQPGIEPGSTAWKAAMLTTIPLTLVINLKSLWVKKKHFFLMTEKMSLPWPGFEPGLLRPQRRVLTTRRSRLETISMCQSF